MRKSVFVAHCTRLHSLSDLPALTSHLHRSTSRLKRATHCMYACRIASPAKSDVSSGKTLYRQDDGGEKGAGEFLADILEKGECHDTIVIVWRWYGGVKLGGERWRVIGRVAREALKTGGFFIDKQHDLTDRKRKCKGKGK